MDVFLRGAGSSVFVIRVKLESVVSQNQLKIVQLVMSNHVIG